MSKAARYDSKFARAVIMCGMSKGVLAHRARLIEESVTLALNARAKELKASGQEVYNLTAGELAIETPDYIQKHVAKTLHLNKYTPAAGLPELRQAIAKEASSFYGPEYSADNVVVTAGAKPALAASFFSLINPGDEVIVPVPMWVSYRYIIELAGGKVIEAPLNKKFDLDVQEIMRRVTGRTKAIIINSPHNPTGSIFSSGSLEKLAKSIKGKAITVISDDIYAKLVFDQNYKPTQSYGFDRIVIINGFSKSQAITGWRIGYLVADKEIARSAGSLLSHIMGNAPVQSQQAALAALKRHDKPPALPSLKMKRRIIERGLAEIPKLSYNLPRGAFYVFLDLKGVTSDSSAWCEELLSRTGVMLVPGEAFSAPGYARMSFVADERTLEAALARLKTFISRTEQSQ